MESTDLKQTSPDAPVQESAAPAKPVKVPKPRKKRKWLKRVIALVVLAAVILVLLRACSGGGTARLMGWKTSRVSAPRRIVPDSCSAGAPPSPISVRV